MLNEQTFEFSQARLKLKESLRFTMRESGGGIEYLVEDEVIGRFYRIGHAQYTFLTMLDGRRTVSDALMKTASLVRELAIDESEAANLCKWAIESGLIESEVGNSAARRLEQHETMQKQQMVSYLNPMMLRMPLFNPDPVVTVVTRFASFLISPLGAMMWIAVVVFGFMKLAVNWDQFYLNRVNSFDAMDFVWIAVTWMILKVVHELAHSVVCKKFGGRVKNCGFLLLLLIPMPYVDVTSSWRFHNKWKRILTSAAGMLSEVFIAAIACIVWASAAPGPLKYHAGNVIITATLHTLLFNINPLMRFDGYYMLSDFLEIPNLSMHGRAWFKGIFKRLYFGNKPAPLKETGFRGLAIRLYGIFAMVWFGFICVGLSLGASGLIEGFGLIVAIIGCVMWLGIPLFKLAKYFLVGTKIETPNRLWFVTAMTITLLAIGCFLKFTPSPTVVSSPIVIDYEPLSIVRANATGFAKEIRVVDGQLVEEGDLLVVLENRELEHELVSLRTDIEISKLRLKTFYAHSEISQAQLEQESLESMYKKRDELTQRLAAMEIRAPQDGMVIARQLDVNEGKHLQPGDEVLSIAQPRETQAIALARQSDIEWFEDNPNAEIQLRIWGRHENAVIDGTIATINPRARDDLPHEAFAANVGGPLAVVPRTQVEGSSGDSQEGQEMMLTEPRIPIEISLSEADRASLYAGQTGEMIVRNRDQNMASYLSENFVRFVRNNNLRTHGL